MFPQIIKRNKRKDECLSKEVLIKSLGEIYLDNLQFIQCSSYNPKKRNLTDKESYDSNKVKFNKDHNEIFLFLNSQICS